MSLLKTVPNVCDGSVPMVEVVRCAFNVQVINLTVVVQVELPFTTGMLTDSGPQWTQKL